MTVSTDYTESSGNVFADLGFAQPKEMLAKARLAHLITQIIQHRGRDMEKNSKSGGAKGSVTPSTALLNQRLASFSKPRMLTAYRDRIAAAEQERNRGSDQGDIRS